jgi:hypothetical protein
MKLIHLMALVLFLTLINALPLNTNAMSGLKGRQCTDIAEGCLPPGLDLNGTGFLFIFDPRPDPFNGTYPTLPSIFIPIANITWPANDTVYLSG